MLVNAAYQVTAAQSLPPLPEELVGSIGMESQLPIC